MVAFANKKVDENGNLTDETTQKLVKELLENLVAWTKKLKRRIERFSSLSGLSGFSGPVVDPVRPWTLASEASCKDP